VSWPDRARALWDAWVAVTGKSPPNYNAIALVLAQANHETNCGDAWNGSRNWGACNLRSMNDAELAAFKSGSLSVGDYLYSDQTTGRAKQPNTIGVLEGDSDPLKGGYRVWFAVFPDDTRGAAYMLRAGVKGARAVLDDPECAPHTFAKALYAVACYYGGVHPTPKEKALGWPLPRVCTKRTGGPENPSEEANVNDYTTALLRNLPIVDAGLAGWSPPGAYSGPAPADAFTGHADTPNAGDEIAPADVIEEEETPTKPEIA